MRTKLNIPPEAMKYMTIGIEFAGIFMAVLFIGILLDRRFGFTPLFIVLGMVGGFAGSMYRVLRTAREYEQECKKLKKPAVSQSTDNAPSDSEAEDEDRGPSEG